MSSNAFWKELESLFDLHYVARESAHQDRSAYPFDLEGRGVETMGGLDTRIRMTREQVEQFFPQLADVKPPYDPNEAMIYGKSGMDLGIDRDILVPLRKQHHNLLRLCMQLPFDEASMRAVSIWMEACMRQQDRMLDRIHLDVQRMLLRSSDSLLLLYSFRDDLRTDIFIDRTKSNVTLDLEKGLATTGGTRYKVRPRDLQMSEVASGIGAAVEMDTRPSEADKNKPPLLLSRRVFLTERDMDVVLQAILMPSEIADFAETNGVVIQLNAVSGVEEVRLKLSFDDGNQLTLDHAVKSNEVVFGWNRRHAGLSGCTIEFVSTRPSGSDTMGTYHDLVVQDIYLLQGSVEGTFSLHTNPIAFVDREGQQSKFRALLLEMEASHVQPWVSVELEEGKGFEQEFRVQPGIEFGITGGRNLDNLSSRADQLVAPWMQGGNQHVAMLNYPLTGFYFSPLTQGTLNTSGAVAFDMRDLTVVRNLGAKMPYVSPTSPNLSDRPDTGWQHLVNAGGSYRTQVIIRESQDFSFDLGPLTITINGRSVSGKVTLSAGVHAVTIPAGLWTDLQFTNPADIKRADPHYPHNPRYLIQGMDGVPEYIGVPFFAERVLTYVDPEYLMADLGDEVTRRGQYSLDVSLDQLQTIQTRILLPIEPGYNQFYRERVAFWLSGFRADAMASRFKIRFEFFGAVKQQATLSSYEIRGL